MPACNDGSFIAVFGNFDARHVVVPKTEAELPPVQLMPRRFGGQVTALTLSIPGHDVLSGAPNNKLLLAGGIKVGIDHCHEQTPRRGPTRPGIGKQSLKLKGPPIPASALPCH
jgi:hypothetical protein